MKTIITDSIPILISLLASIIFYKRLQPKWLQLFFYFLLFSFAVDIAATLYSWHFKKSNHFIINIYLPVTFSFYFFILYKSFEIKKIKLIISGCFLVYM